MNRRQSNWWDTNWRQVAAYVYFAICLADFILFPIFFAWYFHVTNNTFIQWQPITLQGAGVLHLSFGALLTANSLGRTKEKIHLPNEIPQNDPEK